MLSINAHSVEYSACENSLEFPQILIEGLQLTLNDVYVSFIANIYIQFNSVSSFGQTRFLIAHSYAPFLLGRSSFCSLCLIDDNIDNECKDYAECRVVSDDKIIGICSHAAEWRTWMDLEINYAGEHKESTKVSRPTGLSKLQAPRGPTDINAVMHVAIVIILHLSGCSESYITLHSNT